MGRVWIYNKIYNSFYERDYNAGDILTCYFGILFGIWSLGIVSPNIKAITEGRIAGKMAFDVIDRVPKINCDDPNVEKISGVEQGVEFRNVSFAYPSRPDSKVLDNFSVRFEIGKTYALVGSSGCGKSTIAQLLERFYDPSIGEILVDGKNLKDVHLGSYRQQIGFVGQEPVLFNTTVKENIKFGNPNATDEEINMALKYANAQDFINNLNDGINTSVGQSGSQLSGGQKQRIAIARAFVRRPKIIIFDEATSALDKKNEEEVQKTIDSIKMQMNNVIIIIITHRLTTIQNVDKIFVLDKGKIQEEGTHSDILNSYPQGIYAKLVAEQTELDIYQYKGDEEFNKIERNMKTFEDHYIEQMEIKRNILSDNFEMKNLQSTEIINKQLKQDKVRPSCGDTPDTLMEYEDPNQRVGSNQSPLTLESEEIVSSRNQPQESESMIKQNQIKKNFTNQSFFNLLSPYNKPKINIVLGLIISGLQGSIMPLVGAFLAKVLFAFFISDLELMKAEADKWVLGIFLLGLCSFLTVFLQKFLFRIVGENITQNIRAKLYSSLLEKDMQWFDMRENAPGVLTSVLANESSILNGVSSEALAVVIESLCALNMGIAIGFAYNWKISLVALGSLPLIIIPGFINAKITADSSDPDHSAYKDADLLLGESIVNNKTVAYLGIDDIIVKQYKEYLNKPAKKLTKKYYIQATIYGISQFTQQAVYSLLFYAGARFMYKDGGSTSESIFTAIFAMMFGGYNAGQANQFGPDVGKAKKAATKIFTYIEDKPQINSLEHDQNALDVPKPLNGRIEFRNVWFRYPNRSNEWILKGFNLTINENQSIAIVGQSGSGKSTIASLLLRFYDPDEGEILIDGTNIKKFKLNQLRARMGIVMQEPKLLNYNIQENILYGNDNATNSEIIEAAQIANASEFIESSNNEIALEKNASQLIQNFENQKEDMLAIIGEKRYYGFLKELNEIKQNEEKECDSKIPNGLIDQREESMKDVKLHSGFDIDCGVNGGKLSGGQKQRIAIARAVIRKPNILILDEATSALDEESQRKVQKALDNVMEGRTSIVIAHRLSTVEKCDRVVVLSEGNIVDDGKFSDLITKNNGYFANFYIKLNSTTY